MADRSLRTLLMDDEMLARLALRQALEKHGDFQVVGECANAIEGAQAIRMLRPDVVFVDIQMPGPSGIDFIRDLPGDARPEVVYVTAFSQHAVDAFDLSATDYIVKPIDQERFDRAVARLRERLCRPPVEQASGSMVGSVESATGPERISVRDGERLRVIAIRDIDWVRADGNYVHIHAGPLRVMHRVALAALAEQLGPRRFLRIHRGTLVNVERIAEIHPLFRGGAELVLLDGTRLTLSRRYRTAAQAALGLP